jgi:arylsulfatase A
MQSRLSRFAVLLAALAFCCGGFFTPARAASLPNIVILYADDMGYGDLGANNPQSKIPTPHLDRLAAEGLRFTDAHSSSGVCTPSRYALLTGRYHWRAFHDIVNSFGASVFKPEQLTLPEMLREKGYRTACVGKWHLGWDWDAIKKQGATETRDKSGKNRVLAPDAFDWSKPIPDGPLAHGFDSYFGDDVPNFPPYAWIENDRVTQVPSAPLEITPKTAEGGWEARPGPMVPGWDFHAVMPTLTQRAVQWIGEQRAEKPFFLYFPFTSPHAPIVPTPEFTGKSQAGGYGDFMVQTDWTVGQVLAALEKNGFAKNTLVLFSADNGPEQYAYARIQNFQHRSSGELRGVKRDIWEGGHRVPMIVRWPGVVKPGTVTDGLMSQIDVMATVASIVGYKLPATAADDSHDQLKLWTGQGGGARRTIIHNTNKDHYAAREGSWVLINAKSGAVTKVPPWFDQENNYPPNDGDVALYDLAKDLPQRHNLAAQHPEKVAQLQALLAKTRAAGEVRRGR